MCPLVIPVGQAPHDAADQRGGHGSEPVADAGEDVYGRRRGEEAFNRVTRTPGVGREGPKRLIRVIEQIVDLDESRELLPVRTHSTVQDELVTQRSLLVRLVTPQPLRTHVGAGQ